MFISVVRNPRFFSVENDRGSSNRIMKWMQAGSNKIVVDNNSFDEVLRLKNWNYNLCRQINRQVRTISFFNCQVSGDKLEELIEKMTRLSAVCFNFCEIPFLGMDVLTRMNVGTLEIGLMRLNKRVGELAGSKITALRLVHCGLHDEDVESLAKEGFQKVDLTGSQERDNVTIRGALALAASQTITDLSFSGFMERWSADDRMNLGRALAKNTSLTRLDIRRNKMSFGVALLLARSETLRHLNFSNNGGSEGNERDAGRNPSLSREGQGQDKKNVEKSLNVEESPPYQGGVLQQSDAFEAFASNRVLRSLQLNHCGVRNENLVALSHNQSLTSLSVEANCFSDPGVAALANHPTITNLHVGFNDISNEVGFNKFVPIRSLNIMFLKHMDQDSVTLSRKIAEDIATLPNLRSLSIGDNRLREGINAFFRTETLTSFSFFPRRNDDYDYQPAMEIMNARTSANRRVVHNWQRVCFLLASYRANRTSPIRDSILALSENVMIFSSFDFKDFESI